MSERRLPIPKAISRNRTAPTVRVASTSSWNQDDRETAVTAYDELWFLGRPKLP